MSHALLCQFRRKRERGATAVEYAVLVGLISAAILIAMGTLGTQLAAFFQATADALP